MTHLATPIAPDEGVVDYYTETGMDYRTWSRGFNMHFGYWRWGLSPFAREPMLEEMSRQVWGGLNLPGGPARVYDLGCGLGASLRTIARIDPEKRLVGWSVVPWQIEQAAALNRDFPSVSVRMGSYFGLPVRGNTVDAAYALESCCHAPGEGKPAFLRELHRVLKPGAPFVVVDGFTLRRRGQRPALFQKLLDWTCEGFALPCFPDRDAYLAELAELGFSDIEVRDLSFRIAPTVLQAPPLVCSFALRKWLQGEPLNEVRWKHLRACLVSLAVGAFRRDFGYLMIRGRKAP